MTLQGHFGSSAFFVNNFLSNWDRESRKAPLCWQWDPEMTYMQLFFHLYWYKNDISDISTDIRYRQQIYQSCTYMQLGRHQIEGIPSSIHDLRPEGLFWPELHLGFNRLFDLYQTKSISFDAAWWEDYNGACILLYGHFWRSYEQKKNNLWVVDLTPEVTSWPETLNLETDRCVS